MVLNVALVVCSELKLGFKLELREVRVVVVVVEEPDELGNVGSADKWPNSSNTDDPGITRCWSDE